MMTSRTAVIVISLEHGMHGRLQWSLDQASANSS